MELRKEDFEAFLRAMEPEDIAGYRLQEDSCPIAQWSGAVVGGLWLIWLEDDEVVEEMAVPAWIARFVTAVDSPGYEADKESRVRVRECLEILADMEED